MSRLLLALTVGLVLATATAQAAGKPAVSGSSITCEGQILVYGANFDGADLRVHVQTEPTRKATDQLPTAEELKASLARVLAEKAQLPAEPDAKDRGWAAPDAAERSVLTMQCGGTAGSSSFLKQLRVRTAEGTSAPYLLNRPEIWGTAPYDAVPGQPVTVWGVNIGWSQTTTYPWFAVVSAAGEVAALCKGYFPSQNQHANRVQEFRFYRTILLPEDLAPGSYRLYCWNGWGDLGWSEAHALTVGTPPQPPAHMFKLGDFGATGDGVTDDTQAFVKAFAAATQAGGGRITLAPGRYVVSQVLSVPANVQLVGVSREACVIVPSPTEPLKNPALRPGVAARPFDFGLIRIQGDGITLQDLTFDVTDAATEPFEMPVLYLKGGNDLVLRRVAVLQQDHGAFGPNHDNHYWDAVWGDADTKNLLVEGCLFSTSGNMGISTWWNHMTGARWLRNTFTTSDPHSAMVLLFLGCITQECLFEDNLFVNGGRGKTAQSNPRVEGLTHDLWLHNTFRDLWKGDGELLMYETGDVAEAGAVASADATHLTAAAPGWTPSDPAAKLGEKPAGRRGYQVMILSGAGVGQRRTVVSNDATTLTLDQPWRVAPDTTSRYGLLDGPVVECLHLGNEFYNCQAYTGIYGAGYRNVWVNEIYENVTLGLVWWAIEGPRAQYLNLAYGEKFNSRGGVVVYNRRQSDATDPAVKAAEMAEMKVFGNEVRGCSLRERSYVSTENGQIYGRVMEYNWGRKGVSSPLSPVPGTEAAITVYDEPPYWGGPPTDPVLDTFPISTRWNLLAENQIVRCPVGIEVGKGIDRTVLRDNTFYETPTPVLDLGKNTLNLGSFAAVGGKPVVAAPAPTP